MIVNKNKLLQRVVFVFPIVFVFIIILHKILFGASNDAYLSFIHEDGIVEYATSITYFVSVIFSVLSANFFIKTKRKIFGCLFLSLAIALGFAGFEEISWGQRIFNLETPEWFSFNRQNQINFHNLEGIHKQVQKFMMVIGGIGSFMWIVIPRRYDSKNNSFVRFFVPAWFLMLYFIPIFIFYFIQNYPHPSLVSPEGFRLGLFHHKDQEPAEFLLSLGFLFFVVTTFFRQIKPLNSSKE